MIGKPSAPLIVFLISVLYRPISFIAHNDFYGIKLEMKNDLDVEWSTKSSLFVDFVIPNTNRCRSYGMSINLLITLIDIIQSSMLV